MTPGCRLAAARRHPVQGRIFRQGPPRGPAPTDSENPAGAGDSSRPWAMIWLPFREGLAGLLKDAGHEVVAWVGDADALLAVVASTSPTRHR